MKREIKFIPYPMRDGAESTLELWFQVIGELGVTEFQIATNWYTDGVVELRLQEMKKDVWKGDEDYLLKHFYMGPQPLDVCYFSPKRMSEDDTTSEDGALYHAEWIGKPCYYGYKYKEDTEGEEQSTAFAYETLLRGGNEALWKYLEDYYVEIFGELR
jgi:hypothetical protein